MGRRDRGEDQIGNEQFTRDIDLSLERPHMLVYLGACDAYDLYGALERCMHDGWDLVASYAMCMLIGALCLIKRHAETCFSSFQSEAAPTPRSGLGAEYIL